MDNKFANFNEIINSIPEKDFQEQKEKQYIRDEKEFTNFKEAFSKNFCNYCNHPIEDFIENKPCFHWLLNPKGFKKKHFPLLYKGKDFHQIDAYLRWVSNYEVPIKNINDLVEEKSSSKFIETTIKYKNIEWSFSCSHSDLKGHKNSYEGENPHYHFQMKVDGYVKINYNGFHIPFNDYDEFSFAIERGEIDKFKAGYLHGAGMQSFLDHYTPEELVNNMIYAKNEEDSDLRTEIMIMADEGTTISGDEIADMFEERKRTGIPMAKLVQRLKNVKTQVVISPGPTIPEIASRNSRRNKTT